MVKLFTAHRPKAARGQPEKPPESPEGRPTAAKVSTDRQTQKEIGGPSGPEPTRYGDWERKGICVDF